MFAARNGHVPICKWLLEDLHQDVNHKDAVIGSFALLEAAAAGETDCCVYLHQRGSNLNLSDNDGFTALMMACQNGHLDTAKRQVQLGASVEICANTGTTCLMLAACRGHVDICAWLIEDLEVDINAVDEDNDTALNWAELED